MVSSEHIRNHIDFTCVKPHVSEDEARALCVQAVAERVKTLYVPPAFLSFATIHAKGVSFGTTAGFPYGNVPYAVKEAGIYYAAAHGARWVDVPLNVSFIRSHQWENVEQELQFLKKLADTKHIGLKVIVESPYLDEQELVRIAQTIETLNIAYLKTATGVGNQVSEKEVEILRPHLKNTKLKVAGGIKTLEHATRFFELGADKIGSSTGFAILEQAKAYA